MEEVRIFDNCVILSLTVHVIGNKAQGDMGEITTEADKELLTLNKKLLDCPEYDALSSLASKIRADVKSKCLGAASVTFTGSDGQKKTVGRGLQSLVKSGCYLVPVAMIVRVQEMLDELTPNFNAAVAKLCEVYETRQEESRQRLGPQYNPKNYYGTKGVRRACYIDYKYLSVGVPESLKEVKEDIWRKEKEKAEKVWSEATEEIRTVMRVGLKGLVDHMAESLKPGPDGKRKKFYDTTITKMKEFLDDFPMKNVVGDNELAGVVAELRGLLAGKTANSFKTSSEVRERVLQRLEGVKTDLNELVEKVPSRMVLIED